jgi:hypothetical protein
VLVEVLNGGVQKAAGRGVAMHIEERGEAPDLWVELVEDRGR